MLARFKIPKTLLWVANLMVIFLVIFTIFRLVAFFAFKGRVHGSFSFGEIFPCFLMGLRYDLRWISIMLLPIVLISMQPRWSPFFSARNKKMWSWYLVIITFIVFVFFGADFGSFDYNIERLNAGAMNFAEDFSISLKMIYETYPWVWMLLGLVVATILFRWMYHKSHWRVINKTDGKGIPYRRKYFVIATLVMCFLIYGGFAWSPLSRSDSFRFGNDFKSHIAVNPLQNFFSTLAGRRPVYNEKKAREVFPLMAEKLQLPQTSDFSFRREVQPGSNAMESRPNIVLVQCESFSMYKSTMSGNPLNTTPFFDSLCKNGIFFERCFTPHFSTARGLFAILFGIPDAQLFKFSSRNPEALEQHTIIDNFTGYNKHYFLGGDPEFNNFVGLLQNINGLQMHTEGSFKSPKLNVWGISDKDLFLEANDILKKETKPFFAYIQTSDNHRPFMIPPGDTDFEKHTPSIDMLRKYGFESVGEYNAFRYSDYCFRKFMEAVQKETYFHNTIFVFVGDHGVAGDASAMYPSAWTDQRLTDEHVPLLFYAPYLLQPQWRKEVVSQIDVLPTIAGMLQQHYVNTTLGRDLLDPAKKHNFAFITNTTGKIGMVTDDFYFIKHLDFPNEELVPVRYSERTYSKAERDSIKKDLSKFTTAYFETARYLIMNNKKD